MKILVRYRDKLFYWVSSVVEHDENEWDVVKALLVSANCVPLVVPVETIVVVDKNYFI